MFFLRCPLHLLFFTKRLLMTWFWATQQALVWRRASGFRRTAGGCRTLNLYNPLVCDVFL